MPPPHDATFLDSEQGGAKTNLPSGSAYSELVEPEAFVDARNVAIGVKNTQDIPASSTSANALKNLSAHESSAFCEFCQDPKSKNLNGSRNLIVCFDGTSHQFGEHNTNVVELYSRIIKDDTQPSYYSSGIGTYATPSWRSLAFWAQVIYNKIDLAIAWNFERALLAGYRWLSDNYRPGDYLFIFGFSRGAYQARVLAAMIKKVGLILPGNEEQIPFAFELYAELKAGVRKSTVDMTARFKETFARRNVKVHFLGVWDTVSSIGVIRGKSMPGTTEVNDDVCYFRHALALDERRVKFLPEYVCGGLSHDTKEQKTAGSTSKASEPSKSGVGVRIKEVWFPGCHSDIGGGNERNEDLNNAAVPVLWMANEARFAGLRLNPSKVQWSWDELEKSRPKESLNFIWRIFEVLPFRRLSYSGVDDATWWPHLSRGRVIQPGQKIHASVCFIGGGYTPKARFSEVVTGDEDIDWTKLIGVAIGKKDGLDWARPIRNILEMDLFDLSNVKVIMDKARGDLNNVDFMGRLHFLASTDEGARAILDVPGSLQLIDEMLRNKRKTGILLLSKLVGHDTTRSILVSYSNADLIGSLSQMISSEQCEFQAGAPEAMLFTKMAQQWDMSRLPYYIGQLLPRDLRLIDALHILAVLCFMRFELKGQRIDLDKAEELLRKALDHQSPDRTRLLNTLAQILQTKANLAGGEKEIQDDREIIGDFQRHRDLALDAAQKAVDLARQLAKDDEPTSLCSLAMSYYSLSTHFASQGREKDALPPVRECVGLYQRLQKAYPTDFTHDLAIATSYLSSIHSELGERESALRTMKDAVALHRELAGEAGPTALARSALANALNNLSNRLADHGDHVKAAEVIEESLEISRLMAKEYPTLLTQNLATCLEIYSSRLADLCHGEAALQAIEEAVELRRQLTEEHPNAFDKEHVNSLNLLSARLSELGRRREALKVSKGAVESCRLLAAKQPMVFNQELAKLLINLSDRQRAMGHREDGLNTAREMVELHRRLAKDLSSRFDENLTEALYSLSGHFANLALFKEALAALEEALEIRRRLAADLPDVHNPILATYLDGVSYCLSGLGHRKKALAASEEAVKLRRSLASNQPSVYNAVLAVSLWMTSSRLAELARPKEAVEALKEAIEICRQLAADLPDVHNPGLATCLVGLSRCLSYLGHREEALAASQEAVKLCRSLASKQPSVYNAPLSVSLWTTSSRLAELARHKEAVEPLKEAIEICRQLVADLPDVHDSTLATYLAGLSRCLSGLGHREEALVATQEAAGLRQSLASRQPSVYNAPLRIVCLICAIPRRRRLRRRLSSCIDPLPANSPLSSIPFFPSRYGSYPVV